MKQTVEYSRGGVLRFRYSLRLAAREADRNTVDLSCRGGCGVFPAGTYVVTATSAAEAFGIMRRFLDSHHLGLVAEVDSMH